MRKHFLAPKTIGSSQIFILVFKCVQSCGEDLIFLWPWCPFTHTIKNTHIEYFRMKWSKMTLDRKRQLIFADPIIFKNSWNGCYDSQGTQLSVISHTCGLISLSIKRLLINDWGNCNTQVDVEVTWLMLPPLWPPAGGAPSSRFFTFPRAGRDGHGWDPR